MSLDDSTVICTIGTKTLRIRPSATDSALPTLLVLPGEDVPPANPSWRVDPSLLDPAHFKHIHVIVSALSGTHLAPKFHHDLLLPTLKELGILSRCTITHTTSPTSVTGLAALQIAPAAARGEPQLLILLSGDGGVSDLLNALLPPGEGGSGGEAVAGYRAPELALLPLGTGNALAHSSGLTDPTWGLAALARGTPTPLPAFVARFSPGAALVPSGSDSTVTGSTETGAGGGERVVLRGSVVCSWGLHAGLVADSDGPELRRFGAARFGMAAKAALWPEGGGGPHPYRGRVEVLPVGSPDGKGEGWVAVPREEHAYVLGAMVAQLEKGFAISPESRPLDARLWLVHFGPRGGDEVMRLMGLAYKGGEHVKEEGVGYEEVEGFRISFDDDADVDPKWRRICVDGKIVVVEPKGWVEVRKAEDKVLAIRHIA
jgi:diacylglycerol kinase family enzyme